MVTKQMVIKNRTYYFNNDLINIIDFDERLLKLDKKNQWCLIYITLFILLKVPHRNVNSVNPLHFIINRIDGFIEEKDGDKYLSIASTDRNSEVLKNTQNSGVALKIVLKKINDSEWGEYDKDFTKIKFNSDNDIPLNKQLYFLTVQVIIRNIFEKDGKYYPQLFLDDCLYEV